MNREEAKILAALAPVIAAFAEGKEVEYRYIGGQWCVAGAPNFGFNARPIEWRVKPKPKKLYVVRRSNGGFAADYTDKAKAEASASDFSRGFGQWAPYYVETYTQDSE